METGALTLILQQYGIIAIFCGTFLEGETVLSIAGYLAHQRYLQLQYVIAAAAAGHWAAAQGLFLVGRVKGISFLQSHASLQQPVTHAQHLLEHYPRLMLFGFRFIFGTKVIGPLLAGTTHISVGLFTLLNTISAIVWAVLFGAAGYLFGHSIQIAFDSIRKYEPFVIGILAAASVAIWWHRTHARKKAIGGGA